MNHSYNHAGGGAFVADSVTTTGGVSAGTTVTAGTGITATTGNIVATAGNVRGEIVEFASNASGPGVRDYADTDTGFGRTAANQPAIWSGGTQVLQGSAGASVVVPTNIELSGRGRMETRLERRNSWRTAITVVAATQIPAAGAFRVQVDPSGGAATSTAAPLISGSPGDGDEISITNVNASNAYTLNHHGNAGVNSKLLIRGGTTVALTAGGGTIHFRYRAADDRWYELGRSI